jgi:hypothetical protein
MRVYRLLAVALAAAVMFTGRPLAERLQQAPAAASGTAPFDTLHFRPIGPASMSGRISDLAVYEQNPAVYYVATAHGGVWKTRVVPTGHHTVVVEVEATGDAGVGLRDEVVGVIDAGSPVVGSGQVVVAEQLSRQPTLDEVELVDEEDVGVHALDGLGDVGGLGVVRCREVAHQLAFGVAVERGVERRETDVLVDVGAGGGRGRRQCRREQARPEDEDRGDGGEAGTGQ